MCTKNKEKELSSLTNVVLADATEILDQKTRQGTVEGPWMDARASGLNIWGVTFDAR